jgi:4-carboxymuconolactone decarboxylase
MPDAPLLPPLPSEEWNDDVRSIVGSDGPTLNIFATLAHHPKLMKRWIVFGNHVLAKSTLPARHRELLILRTGWNCRSPYEWGQHVAIARTAGLDDTAIARVADGPEVPGWDPFDRVLLQAADELHDDACLTESTYAALAERYDARQMLDLVFTVGQYHIVAMAVNSFRVQRDDGVTGIPMPDR